MKAEWHESFFTPLALDFWRAAVSSDATEEEVGFLVENLALSPPSKLLDLPCGFGRHALALASRGYRITGIDLASSEIEAAQRDAQSRGLVTANFQVGDMRLSPTGGPYDGAYCFGNSFGYFSHQDNLAFIRNVFHAVRSGGRWIIETGIAAESILPGLVEQRHLEAGGIAYDVRNAYDAAGGRLIQSCTLSRGAEREQSQISYGVYTVAELNRMLQSEGWRPLKAVGSRDGRPFQLGDRRLYLIAERS